MSGRRVLFWFVIGCLVFYVIKNPDTAAANIRGAFDSGTAFLSGLLA